MPDGLRQQDRVMSSVTTQSSPARGGGTARPRGGGATAAPSARSIDPFRVLRRHVWLLIASIFIGAGIGAAAWYGLDRAYPLYSGEVRFELQPGLKQSREVGTQDFGREDEVVRLGQTEISMLLGRDVLMEAVRTPQVENTEWLQSYTLPDGVSIDYESAVDDLRDTLNAGLVRNSNLFRVAWSTHEAEDVPVVLNRVANAYINKRRQMDESRHRANIELFNEEMNRTADEIDQLSEEIEDFIRERGITALDDPRFHQTYLALNSTVHRIQEATVNLNVARTEYDRIQRKLEGTIRPTADDRMRAEMEPVIARLDQQVNESKAALFSLRERRIDRNNDGRIRDLEARIRGFEEQREAKIQELINRNLESDLKMTADQIHRLQRMLEELETDYEEKDESLRELAASYSEFKELERQRTRLEELRSTDMALIRELQMLRLRDDAARVRIWQNAQVPRQKSFPQLKLMLPLGVILTLGLTTGLVFLREMTDQRVKTVSDLGLIPGARVVGVIPDRDEDPTGIDNVEMVVRDQPSSVLAESYRQACAPLMKVLDMSQHQSLLVLGSLPGSGTTTTVSNIAATYAAAGRRVLAVDANFRRPGLAKALGIENHGPGLGDLLHEATTIDEAIIDAGSGVDLLSCGTVPHRVFERLNTPRFDQLMAQLRERYDLIVLDAPPAVVAGEAIALANKADATLLLVPANEAQRGLVARLINQLADTRSELIGIMLNRARGTTGGYFKKNFATIASYSASSER